MADKNMTVSIEEQEICNNLCFRFYIYYEIRQVM